MTEIWVVVKLSRKLQVATTRSLFLSQWNVKCFWTNFIFCFSPFKGTCQEIKLGQSKKEFSADWRNFQLCKSFITFLSRHIKIKIITLKIIIESNYSNCACGIIVTVIELYFDIIAFVSIWWQVWTRKRPNFEIQPYWDLFRYLGENRISKLETGSFQGLPSLKHL